MASQESGPLYGVIMAGGVGTRFWPKSRRGLPKQFLAIGEDSRSLIRATFDRLEPITGADRILVVANEDYRDLVLEQLPELAPQHFIGEPMGRNTAPCIGLAAHCVARECPDASMIVCPADHVIGPREEFERSVRFAQQVLSENPGEGDATSVLFGIPPTCPHTGYGYLEKGEPLAESADLSSSRVARFKEKPCVETAEEYVASGCFFWNSGIFLWNAAGLVELMKKYLPDIADSLETIALTVGEASRFRDTLHSVFPKIRKESIDYGVLEKASNVVLVEASFRWDDVGSWDAVSEYLPIDEAGNRVEGRHVGLETRNCVVVADRRLVATVGVENIVVVDTEDALLVCHRDRVEDVKKIVEQLEEQGVTELL